MGPAFPCWRRYVALLVDQLLTAPIARSGGRELVQDVHQNVRAREALAGLRSAVATGNSRATRAGTRKDQARQRHTPSALGGSAAAVLECVAPDPSPVVSRLARHASAFLQGASCTWLSGGEAGVLAVTPKARRALTAERRSSRGPTLDVTILHEEHGCILAGYLPEMEVAAAVPGVDSPAREFGVIVESFAEFGPPEVLVRVPHVFASVSR